MTGDPALLLHHADIGHSGHAVLLDVSLRVAHGEKMVLVGDNGSGKTTLLRTLTGLHHVSSGTVRVHGHDPVRDRARVHTDTGVLGHEEPLYPELSAEENLRFHARLRGMHGAAAEAAVERALHDVGMQDARTKRFGACSRGMQRRLGLAKALLGTPRTLILDEPETGLDHHARAAFTAILRGLDGPTVLVATHDPTAYAGWAQRIVHLAGGRIAHDTGSAETPLSADRIGAIIAATRPEAVA